MASQTDVANLALTLLGAARITNISDNSKSARAISAVIELQRRIELRKRFWSFAIVRTSLPALGTAPAFGYAKAYQLPADYLRMVQVNDFYAVPSLMDYRNGDDSLYAIEAGTIVTDLGAPLKIRYVQDVTDFGRFDPLFDAAFAARLAYVTCEEITNSNTKRDAMMKEYSNAIRDAASVNAIERPPQGIADDSWMLGRL